MSRSVGRIGVLLRLVEVEIEKVPSEEPTAALPAVGRPKAVPALLRMAIDEDPGTRDKQAEGGERGLVAHRADLPRSRGGEIGHPKLGRVRADVLAGEIGLAAEIDEIARQLGERLDQEGVEIGERNGARGGSIGNPELGGERETDALKQQAPAERRERREHPLARGIWAGNGVGQKSGAVRRAVGRPGLGAVLLVGRQEENSASDDMENLAGNDSLAEQSHGTSRCAVAPPQLRGFGLRGAGPDEHDPAVRFGGSEYVTLYDRLRPLLQLADAPRSTGRAIAGPQLEAVGSIVGEEETFSGRLHEEPGVRAAEIRILDVDQQASSGARTVGAPRLPRVLGIEPSKQKGITHRGDVEGAEGEHSRRLGDVGQAHRTSSPLLESGPGTVSASRWVPLLVPSVTQGSNPCSSSRARKKTRWPSA